MAHLVLSPETALALGNINKSSVYDDKRSLTEFIASEVLLLVLAASMDELITRDHGRPIRVQERNISRTNMRKWCRRIHLDSWKSLLHLPEGSTPAHDCKRTQGWLMKALR
jgi:hypothetical protein